MLLGVVNCNYGGDGRHDCMRNKNDLTSFFRATMITKINK